MIADGKNFMTTAWWMSIFPGIAIVMAGTGFSLLGDGLAEWLQREMTAGPLLSVRGLRVTFPGTAGELVAVDGVDLDVRRGEVLGLVGESGSGKSVTLRAILRLVNAARPRVR